MPKMALIFCLIGLASYGFKLMHWPGAAIMMVSASAVLLVLWFFWYLSQKTTLYNTVFFLFGVSFLVGFAFKMQHWPGGGIIIGLVPIFAVILITAEMMKKG